MSESNQTPVPYESDTLLSIKQMEENVPALTLGGIRWDIFRASENGLKESGAMVKHGARVFLWRNRYLEWLSSGCA
jgi:hypothetical protein